MPAAADPVALLLAALGSISVPPPDLAQLEVALQADPAQLTLVDLGLDSLSRIEACINLEIDHGVLITPETVASLHSADQLLRSIASAARG
ncbi:MAG: hypothetical protein ACKO8I_13460 [Cyanobacteriota bacterium]